MTGPTLELQSGKDRCLFLDGEVNQKSMNELSRRILEINRADRDLARALEVELTPKPIVLHIDSYGGYVYQCLGLLGVMSLSKTPVHTVVTGCAMSAAFVIAICGHRRIAYPYATLMYHQIQSGMDGTAQAMSEDLEESLRLQRQMEELVLKRTQIPREKLDENREKKQDWYMSAHQAKRLGCVDQIAREQVL